LAEKTDLLTYTYTKIEIKKVHRCLSLVFYEKDWRNRRQNKPQSGVPKSPFWGLWVGAFSVLRAGHTGFSFIFWPFLPKFTKIRRFRGWCNTARARSELQP